MTTKRTVGPGTGLCGAGGMPGPRGRWFAALHIPDFTVAAALLGRPVLQGRPCAVLAAGTGATGKEKLPVAALNQAARDTGIVCGWSLGKALVRCPDLRVLERDPTGEEALTRLLLECATGIAAEIELARADVVIVDLAARREILKQTFEFEIPEGVEIRWVMAATPDLAGLAVEVEALWGRTVEAGDVAGLPVEALRFLGAGNKDLAVLELWGIKSVGEFLRLPRQALSDRLGSQAGDWQAVLKGEKCRLLSIHKNPEIIKESIDLEYFESNNEALVFICKSLLQTIESNALSKRLAVAGLKLVLGLDGGGELVRELRLAEPQVRVDGMLPVVRTFLEGLGLESAVRRVELVARTTFGTAVQREWFGRRELPQPQRWAETVSRLEALLGSDRVGVPVPPGSFKPDGFALKSALGESCKVAEEEYRPDLPVPLRRYRPAAGVAVASGEGPGGWQRPLAVLTGAHAGRITDWRGPFPVSGYWWDAAATWQRVEWDVANEAGELLRLAWLPPGEWRIEGMYE